MSKTEDKDAVAASENETLHHPFEYDADAAPTGVPTAVETAPVERLTEINVVANPPPVSPTNTKPFSADLIHADAV
jgi:hypothetical protein